MPLTAEMEQTAMKLIPVEVGGVSFWRYIRGPGPQSFTFLGNKSWAVGARR